MSEQVPDKLEDTAQNGVVEGAKPTKPKKQPKGTTIIIPRFALQWLTRPQKNRTRRKPASRAVVEVEEVRARRRWRELR